MPNSTVPVDRQTLDVLVRRLREARALIRFGNELGRQVAGVNLQIIDAALTADSACGDCGTEIPAGYSVCKFCADAERDADLRAAL